MAEEKAKTTVRHGRGITNDIQAVNELRFSERDAARNQLFVGHLASVDVLWSTNADGKTFTGMRMPRLQFHFESEHPNKSERRHVRFVLRPVESTTETMAGGDKEWQVNNVFRGIKHMLDVFYLKGRELTPEEIDALDLGFNDSDEKGQYVLVEAQDVLNGYQKVFENVAAMMNGTFGLKEGEVAHPCYKDASGKPLKVWMKLLRYRRQRAKGWQPVGSDGELAFDSFIGSGLVELMQANQDAKVLSVDPSFESITPKQVQKANPTIGGQVAPGAASQVTGGGLPPYANTGGAGDAGFAAGANGDMPF